MTVAARRKGFLVGIYNNNKNISLGKREIVEGVVDGLLYDDLMVS